MKPADLPLLFVQRSVKPYLPGEGSVISVCQARKLYLPSSFPSWAGR
jgi:hypothetical protein